MPLSFTAVKPSVIAWIALYDIPSSTTVESIPWISNSLANLNVSVSVLEPQPANIPAAVAAVSNTFTVLPVFIYSPPVVFVFYYGD